MLEKLYKIFQKSKGVSTDTRTIVFNQIFFALRGPNFDGNQYIELALEKGAIAVVSDDKSLSNNDKIFYTEDALKTLQELANHHRKQFSIPIIGLTGSNGKTTTKELISIVLKKKFNTLSTFGNLNNHIGVPLTLLKISKEHEVAVIEMGANKEGDINELSLIAEPTHGLITSIGKAHLEGFGSIEGVKRGKSELYRFLDSNDGIIFLNNQVEHLREMVPKDAKVIRFGTSDTSLFVEKIISSNPLTMSILYGGKSFEVSTHLFGSFHQNNVLYAIQIGLYFDVPMNMILSAILNYIPSNNRSEQRKWNENTVLLDAYNANPTSMLSAIDEFCEFIQGNKLLLLGDMMELGTQQQEEHQSIVDFVESKQIETILVGEIFYNTHTQSKKIKKFLTLNEATDYINGANLKKYSILVKGSRKMSLEKLFQ
jgi:UDP-N-acetylmuramoyl-tripeptide--D-alanyl-D-alanine ligase